MDKLEPPSSLIFDGNVAEQWKIWRQELELYLTATESDDKNDKAKTSILLTCIGKKGRLITLLLSPRKVTNSYWMPCWKNFKNIVTQGQILHFSDKGFSLVNKAMDKCSMNLSRN